MCLSAVLGIGSALIGASSADSAADAQTAAANQDIAFQRETRDTIIDRVDPFYKGGQTANAAYLYELGLGPRPSVGGNALAVEAFTEGGGGEPAAQGAGGLFGGSRPQWAPEAQQYLDRGVSPPSYMQIQSPQQSAVTKYRVGDNVFATLDEANAYARSNAAGGQQYQGYEETPGFKFAFNKGTDAINAMAGARGGLVSGRTMQDLNKFGIGTAQQEHGNYLNRLAGVSNQGMGAAALQANAATNAASGTSNALAGIGNAQAAGAIGVGNAIQSGLGNIAGLYNYQNRLAQSQPLFGGNSWGM